MGFALALSTSGSLINDVVGSKGDQGAFVYGAYSLADKICCGLVLFYFVDQVKDNTLLLKYSVPILPLVSLSITFFILNQKHTKTNFVCTEDEFQDLNKSKSIIDDSKLSFV
jgi:hypothetical protein